MDERVQKPMTGLEISPEPPPMPIYTNRIVPPGAGFKARLQTAAPRSAEWGSATLSAFHESARKLLHSPSAYDQRLRMSGWGAENAPYRLHEDASYIRVLQGSHGAISLAPARAARARALVEQVNDSIRARWPEAPDRFLLAADKVAGNPANEKLGLDQFMVMTLGEPSLFPEPNSEVFSNLSASTRHELVVCHYQSQMGDRKAPPLLTAEALLKAANA